MINISARELGLLNTQFRTVHGLPPGRGQEADLATAADLAQLGRTLIQFPDALRWAATATAPFRDGEFTLYNPNKLVGRYRGLDGIKTGHHQRAGFCVTASAIRQGHRLIAVVMGCTTDEARATETTRLLSYGFNLFTQLTLIDRAGKPLELEYSVKGGKERSVSLAYAAPLTVNVRRDRTAAVVLSSDLPDKILAPIEEGQEVGRAIAMLDGRILGEVPIIAVRAVPRGNFFQRLFH